MTISKDLDIVLYGATGFTGTLCAEYLAKSSGQIKSAAGFSGLIFLLYIPSDNLALQFDLRILEKKLPLLAQW